MDWRLTALAGAGGAAALAAAYFVTDGDAADPDREAVERIVREYLLENPEVVIDAINAYAQKEQAAEAARTADGARANLAALIAPEDSWIAPGPDDPKAYVIELFDYHCGFCKRATKLTRELLDDNDDLRIVFRELPILREESAYAAEMALAARAQGKYQELHFALMNASGVLTEERVEEIAKKEGLDVMALRAAREDMNVEQSIERTLALAEEIGVSGTPAFIVASPDGSVVEVISGWRPGDIEAAIEKAKRATS